MNRCLIGDARDILPTLEAGSVQMCVSSPPYWGLRSYGVGTENGELGLESTPDEYVANMVQVFREVRRCLRDDGVLWLNLGDSYVANGRYDAAYIEKNPDYYDPSFSTRRHALDRVGTAPRKGYRGAGLKPK